MLAVVSVKSACTNAKTVVHVLALFTSLDNNSPESLYLIESMPPSMDDNHFHNIFSLLRNLGKHILNTLIE